MEHQPIIPSTTNTNPRIIKKYFPIPTNAAIHSNKPITMRLIRSVLSILQCKEIMPTPSQKFINLSHIPDLAQPLGQDEEHIDGFWSAVDIHLHI